MDRVQALLCDRNSGMTLSRPCNRAAARLEEGPRATSPTRFQRCPGCLSGCLSTCATAGVTDDAGPSQAVWITSRVIDYLARGSWATSSGSEVELLRVSRRPGTGSETTQPHLNPKVLACTEASHMRGASGESVSCS